MSAHGTPLLDLVLARRASQEAGFGYDADLALVILTLRERVSGLERLLEAIRGDLKPAR